MSVFHDRSVFILIYNHYHNTPTNTHPSKQPSQHHPITSFCAFRAFCG
jgi:hypothetical protein